MKKLISLIALIALAPLSVLAQDGLNRSNPNPPARPIRNFSANVVTLSPGMTIDLMPYQQVTVSCGGSILPPIQPPRMPECSIQKTGTYNYNILSGGVLQESKSYLSDAIKVVENLQRGLMCAPVDPSLREMCRVEKTGTYNFNVLIGSTLIESKSYQTETLPVVTELRRIGLCR
jgi:hypothetical protein